MRTKATTYSIEREPAPYTDTGRSWQVVSSYHGEAITTGLTYREAQKEVTLMKRQDREAQKAGLIDQHESPVDAAQRLREESLQRAMAASAAKRKRHPGIPADGCAHGVTNQTTGQCVACGATVRERVADANTVGHPAQLRAKPWLHESEVTLVIRVQHEGTMVPALMLAANAAEGVRIGQRPGTKVTARIQSAFIVNQRPLTREEALTVKTGRDEREVVA